MYAGNFASNIDILKNGIYGKDVRQAIFEMFTGHQSLIDMLQTKIDSIVPPDGSEPDDPDNKPRPSNGMVVGTILHGMTITVVSDKMVLDTIV